MNDCTHERLTIRTYSTGRRCLSCSFMVLDFDAYYALTNDGHAVTKVGEWVEAEPGDETHPEYEDGYVPILF